MIKECIPRYPKAGADCAPWHQLPPMPEEGSNSIVTILEVEHVGPNLAQHPTNGI